jgi:hypothetical protein
MAERRQPDETPPLLRMCAQDVKETACGRAQHRDGFRWNVADCSPLASLKSEISNLGSWTAGAWPITPLLLITFPELTFKCLCFLQHSSFFRESSTAVLCFHRHSRIVRSFLKNSSYPSPDTAGLPSGAQWANLRAFRPDGHIFGSGFGQV